MGFAQKTDDLLKGIINCLAILGVLGLVLYLVVVLCLDSCSGKAEKSSDNKTEQIQQIERK